MSCHSQCRGIEQEFNPELARRELRRYRKKGPRKTTRLLLDALCARSVRDATLLDIGGGVGTIQHELLEAGARSALSVDASPAYLEADREEAERRGLADRLEQRFGDFTALAPSIEPADIVTLDRVLCCYDDMDALVRLSAGRARRLYGLVYPREGWWGRIAIPILNGVCRVRGSDFRVFLHSSAAIEAILYGLGFTRAFQRETTAWRVVVYER